MHCRRSSKSRPRKRDFRKGMIPGRPGGQPIAESRGDMRRLAKSAQKTGASIEPGSFGRTMEIARTDGKVLAFCGHFRKHKPRLLFGGHR